MSEEEKQEIEETPDEASAEEAAPAEEEAPAPDEASAEEAPAAEEEEEAPAAEEAPEEPTAAPEAAAEPEEPEEKLSPKQLRKRARSQAPTEARPQRSPEERAAERSAERVRGAAARRRYRTGRGRRTGEPGTGTPPAERRPGPKKIRLGKVVSTKADKTITVQIEVARRHPAYEKIVRRSSTVHAHDEQNEANQGDLVRVVETRPLSRTKRWRLLEIVERAR
jgi:small subunit ribosomal protein S17